MHLAARHGLRTVIALGLLTVGAGLASAQLKPDGNIFFNNIYATPGQTLGQQFLSLPLPFTSPPIPPCPAGYDASVLGTSSFTHNRYTDPHLDNALYQTNMVPNFKPSGGPVSSGAVNVPVTTDNFFQQTCYVGAIDPGGTDWTQGWTYYDSTGANRQDLHLPGMPNPRPLATYNNVNIVSPNQYFAPDSNYRVIGQLRVKSGGALTVAPGVVILEDRASVGTIIVERGGKIFAVGTACDPIIITSAQAPGSQNHGDGGGIYLLGFGKVSNGDLVNGTCDGSVYQAEGGTVGPFGGNDDTDGSGLLRYVRVEFAGRERSANNELNSFTFCGVGNRTHGDYLQAFEGDDDGFEWFGGSMDATHLLAVDGHDDGYDTQYGSRNRAQFVIVRCSSKKSIAGTQNGDHGIEADNTETSPFTQTQCTGRSFIQMANATFVGDQRVDDGTLYPGPTFGVHWRRGVSYTLVNSIIAHFKTGGIGVEHDATWTAHCAAIPANGTLFCTPVAVANEPEVTSGNVLVVRGQPNPFRNQVSFSFRLPKSGPVSVDVYSADGRLVQNLAKGDMSAGEHNLTWKLDKTVPNGMYFYKVVSAEGQSTGKITRMN